MRDTALAATDHGVLLQRCARGDRAALHELFEREAPRMKGVARRILRRDELAEEAMQDAFVRIWQRAGQYDAAGGSALGWIFAVQRSIALNMLRSARREDIADPDDVGAAIDRDAEILSADEIWARLSETSRLRDCLSQLDRTRADALLLAYAYGFTHGEIAGRLARPLGTVKAWLRRGLEALRECMG